MALLLSQSLSAVAPRRATACRAAAPAQAGAPRRAALLGFLAAGAAAALAPVRPAAALIPDEEDEELLERAKANRAQRLAKNQEATRAFLNEEGLTNKQLEGDLAPVQRAVAKLAQSGAQLEAGDVKGASSTLGGGWVDELKRASESLSATDSAKGATQALFDGVSGLRSAAGSGDLRAAKRGYVSAVGALKDWASAAGVAGSLKGL